jgi:hypothetical protein
VKAKILEIWNFLSIITLSDSCLNIEMMDNIVIEKVKSGIGKKLGSLLV